MVKAAAAGFPMVRRMWQLLAGAGVVFVLTQALQQLMKF
jgi:hypothetical protein